MYVRLGIHQLSEIYKNCPWCKGQGVPECRVRRGRGWPDSGGPRSPCTFCSVEREKEEARILAAAEERYRLTGDYRDPSFSGNVEFYMLDTATGKLSRFGSEVQQIDGADIAEAPGSFLKPNCACCGRESEGRLWCNDCELHIDPTKQFFEQSYYSQYHEDCPFQIPHPDWV